MRSLNTVLFIMVVVAVFSGCSSLDNPYPGHGNPYNTVDAVSEKKVEALIPGEEVAGTGRPIVKIIKGEAVPEEEARELLASAGGERPLKGMSENIRSMVLELVPVRLIAELLTELCGYNVVATNRVADLPISIFMRDITLKSALETLCRLNGLWYREGNNIVTLMTRQEYVDDIEIRQDEHTRAFYVNYTNAADMAKVIQAVMGEEVYLAAIEDEKIYGHIDPEEDVDLDGDYDGAKLGGGDAQRFIFINSRQQDAEPVKAPSPRQKGGMGRAEPPEAQTVARTVSKSCRRPLLAILTVFKRNNCIIARSLDDRLLNEISDIIAALDTPTNQVLMEVQIIQVTLADDAESFFKISYGDISGSLEDSRFIGGKELNVYEGGQLDLLEGLPTMASTFSGVLNYDDIQARVSFFEREGRANTVSTPFLMSANNSKVDFFVGEEVPLRDDVKKETVPLGDSGVTINTFIYDIKREELGTDVEITTFINEDETVTFEIKAEISSAQLNMSSIQIADDNTGELVSFPLDGKAKSEIESIVTARSGQAIALGGIIRETVDYVEKKVPVLGDIPGLGVFFKQKTNTKQKTETVIVITPHVINHPAAAGRGTEAFLKRKSSSRIILDGRDTLLSDQPGP